MVLGLEAKGDLFRLLLVMEPEVAACLSRLLREKGLGPLEVEAPVALLFFQGPHYGDRHGIADTALRALEDHGLAPLASACSQSCIYLVLPDAEAEEGESALSAVFLIPREHTSKRRRGA